MLLCQHHFSTDHARLEQALAGTAKLLLIQDLDGVCMGLVRDPLTRVMDVDYVAACHRLRGHFLVLTNGEHVGSRGVNGIVDRCLGEVAHERYLPGLAGGGVQWQDHRGVVEHPGVSEAELVFLARVPARAAAFLTAWLGAQDLALSEGQVSALVAASVLDNRVSPTVNINSLHQALVQKPGLYQELQQAVLRWMQEELVEARRVGLTDAFFIHLAPNLGSGPDGERLKPAQGVDAGTTDFQFMLRGAIKEAGVLTLLNRYFQQHHGFSPLGEAFSVRQAPADLPGLLALARDAFEPELMPRLVGVGDTVTAQGTQRGGSDRGFLTLVQALGQAFDTDNVTVWVDSSGGEVRRPGVDATGLGDGRSGPVPEAVAGISDPQDPLRINFAYPGGHQQYVASFCRLVALRNG